MAGEFKLWLTDDGDKIPVQFEARVKLGKVWVTDAAPSPVSPAKDSGKGTGVVHKPNSVSRV